MRPTRWLGGALLLLTGCDPDNGKAGADDTSAAGEDTGGDVDAVDCDEGFELGQCPPDFAVVDADGATVSLSDYDGVPIIVAGAAEW